MKKLTLALLLLALTSFAQAGDDKPAAKDNKDKSCCCSKEGDKACAKDESCCSKDKKACADKSEAPAAKDKK
jgi:hypothetical protein